MCNFIVCLISLCLCWLEVAICNDQNHSSLPLLTVVTNWLDSKHTHGSQGWKAPKILIWWARDCILTCCKQLVHSHSSWGPLCGPFRLKENVESMHLIHSPCTIVHGSFVLCQFMYISHILHPKLLNKISYLHLLQECLHLVDPPLQCIDMVLSFLTVTIHRLHPKHLGSYFYSPVARRSGPRWPPILGFSFFTLPIHRLHLDFTSTCCKKVCTSSTPHSLTNALSGRLILLLSYSTQLKIVFFFQCSSQLEKVFDVDQFWSSFNHSLVENESFHFGVAEGDLSGWMCVSTINLNSI